MLGHQFAYSAAPIRKVKEVQFGILSPEEIVRRYPRLSSCAVLTNPILHHRKLSLSLKSNIRKSWTRELTSLR